MEIYIGGYTSLDSKNVAMPLELIVTYMLAPAGFGAISALLLARSERLGALASLVLAGGIAVHYLYTEGWEASDFWQAPIAAKDKLAFLLVICGPAALGLSRYKSKTIIASSFGLFLTSFFWIAQRQLFGSFELSFAVLPIYSFAVVSILSGQLVSSGYAKLHWPVALLIVLTCTSIVSLVGGFISLGQLLGATTALWGGALAVVYFFDITGSSLNGSDAFIRSGALGVMLTFGMCLIVLTPFATNLSTPAVVLVLLALATPIIGRAFVRKQSQALQPVLAAMLALVPAGGAAVLAVRNF